MVTKSGGANSLVTEESAVVVDKGSTDALAEGAKEMIRRLGLTSEGVLATVLPEDKFDSESIRTFALSQFEIDEVSKKYMEIYNSITK